MIARILTTTGCNASCAYCYEQGTQVIAMTADIARQTAIFMAQRAEAANACHVSLEWFGGEPTLNIEAIDTISGALCAGGVWFSSSIVTNGLLMDDRITQDRLSLWQLRHVQITLDGPEKVHESVKGFPPGSYHRIIHNIHALTERGLRIKLRLNYAGNNGAISRLIDELGDEFSENGNVNAYICPIYSRSKEYPRHLMQEVLRLQRRLVESGLATGKQLFDLRERKNRCFMMNEDGFTIAPDGRLFNCSHNMTDKQCVGSVWAYDENNPVRREFLSCVLKDECKRCNVFPYCKGGCRIAEMGLADMTQCHPYKTVFSEIELRSKL